MYHALKALAHERLHELTLFWYHFFISLSFASLTPHEKIRNFLMVFLSVNRQSLEEHPFPYEVNPRNVLLWRVHGVCLSFSG